ncbi:UTY-like protein [Mya arenaria]|uniref:UTY-like protein n=1 Tax=Mya arenaria TaxID=6604 RepID=A0ABY7E2W9_MYAAR|nr:UTY-like protein [Mya arenaria]
MSTLFYLHEDMIEMASESEILELTQDERQQLLKFDRLTDMSVVFLLQLLLRVPEGVKFYEFVIKTAVKKAKRDGGKPQIEAAIFCRLGHLLLLLEQYEKALSAYQKYYQLHECHWKITGITSQSISVLLAFIA